MSVSGADIVNRAAQELGDPYVFGATGPNSFDCSGLVQYVFKQYGIKTPRVAADQARFGAAVQRKDIQPGDLIFFQYDSDSGADHVGIYAGNGQMIHAPNRRTVVKRSAVPWSASMGIRRFPGVTGGPATSERPDTSGGIPGAVGGAVGALVPDGITGAIKGIGDQLRGIAGGVAEIGQVAQLVTRAFLPNNIVRGVAGAAGTLFILIGVFFLSREIRNG